MSSLKPNNDILTYAPIQGSQAPQQTSIINNSNLWANIPDELKERPQWVVSGASKAPLYLKNEKVIGAKSTDPATWMSFNDACKLACDNRELITTHVDKHGIEVKQQGYSIGYMLSAEDPFTCIDLDVKDASNCTDASQWTTPDQYERFDSIIKTFNSYTEYSRSGKGFHIWVKGNIGEGRRREGVEVYSQERFIVCTGNTFKSEPINERSELLNNMVTQLSSLEPSSNIELVEKEKVEEDNVIVEKLMRQSNAEKFNNLCSGKWQEYDYPSQSEADLALMSMFCFYSESNEQCRSLFRMSELGKREKAVKDNRYLDYTLRTIRSRQNKEKKDTDAFIQQFNKPKLSFFLTSADLKKLSPPTWLIKNVIPETGFGIIYGKSGTYKSFLTIDLLAHIANGRAWFGNNTKQKPVIYIPLEGKSGISKRIEAWRVHNHSNDQILSIFENINFKDKNNIEYLIEKIKDARLDGGVICIDTLAQAGGDMDENSSKDMGNMIKTFQYIQQELGGIVLVVHHTGKDETKGMRGHSSLYASLDFALECTAHGNLSAQFKIAKSKDSESDKGYKFKMSVINLGYDEDGELITSLAVNPEPIIDIPTSKTRVQNIDRVLMAISENPTFTQIELSRLLDIEKGNMSKHISDLKEIGYIKDKLLTSSGKEHIKRLNK
ncbi:AAA family ATPase [Acinetobacter sp. AS5]|uniref:AAA family ATPase n=1 Tax=Acinetobacter sp. AS5 TaxID=3029187 RepID=UPI003B809BBE